MPEPLLARQCCIPLLGELTGPHLKVRWRWIQRETSTEQPARAEPPTPAVAAVVAPCLNSLVQGRLGPRPPSIALSAGDTRHPPYVEWLCINTRTSPHPPT